VELFRKDKSKFWWYDFTARGKRYRGSTGETNKRRASKVAALKFAAACEDGDPLPKKSPTLKQAAARFLEWIEAARLAPKTRTYYEDGWRLLSTTAISGMRIDTITNDVAERLSFTGSAGNTNCALRTLRRLLHKAEEWKLIRRAPKIKLVPEVGRTLRLDEEAEKKLLAGASACQWRRRTLELFCDIVVLVRDTGMRNEKELYQVRIENIDWDKQLIFVPDSKTPNGVRDIPMSDRAFEVFKRRCGERRQGWVFVSKRSKAGHLTTMAKKFREARKNAGLPAGLVLYCGRHDFGTRILKQTGNLKLVMNTMGHIDVKTAMKYQHPELDIVRTALNDTNAAGTPVRS
jgi:integrase